MKNWLITLFECDDEAGATSASRVYLYLFTLIGMVFSFILSILTISNNKEITIWTCVMCGMIVLIGNVSGVVVYVLGKGLSVKIKDIEFNNKKGEN